MYLQFFLLTFSRIWKRYLYRKIAQIHTVFVYTIAPVAFLCHGKKNYCSAVTSYLSSEKTAKSMKLNAHTESNFFNSKTKEKRIRNFSKKKDTENGWLPVCLNEEWVKNENINKIWNENRIECILCIFYIRGVCHLSMP